jgi:hypothetical protein
MIGHSLLHRRTKKHLKLSTAFSTFPTHLSSSFCHFLSFWQSTFSNKVMGDTLTRLQPSVGPGNGMGLGNRQVDLILILSLPCIASFPTRHYYSLSICACTDRVSLKYWEVVDLMTSMAKVYFYLFCGIWISCCHELCMIQSFFLRIVQDLRHR